MLTAAAGPRHATGLSLGGDDDLGKPFDFIALVARLVEPFRGGDQPRVGRSVGFGLSIVRAIMAAHHGGLVVGVRLPPAAMPNCARIV